MPALEAQTPHGDSIMARGRGACPIQVLEALETFGAPGPLARPVGSRRDDGEERVATGRVRPCAAPPRYALRGGTGADFAAPGNASENGVNAHRAGNGIGVPTTSRSGADEVAPPASFGMSAKEAHVEWVAPASQPIALASDDGTAVTQVRAVARTGDVRCPSQITSEP